MKEERKTQEQESERDGGREERKSSELRCGLKMNICFFTQRSVYKNTSCAGLLEGRIQALYQQQLQLLMYLHTKFSVAS